MLRSLALDRRTILDLGHGPRWYTEKLGHFALTVSVNLSEAAIGIAKTRFPHVLFLAGDLYKLPLPALHFNLVVSQEVFDHVPDQLAFLERAAAVLKLSGLSKTSLSFEFSLASSL